MQHNLNEHNCLIHYSHDGSDFVASMDIDSWNTLQKAANKKDTSLILLKTSLKIAYHHYCITGNARASLLGRNCLTTSSQHKVLKGSSLLYSNLLDNVYRHQGCMRLNVYFVTNVASIWKVIGQKRDWQNARVRRRWERLSGRASYSTWISSNWRSLSKILKQGVRKWSWHRQRHGWN